MEFFQPSSNFQIFISRDGLDEVEMTLPVEDGLISFFKNSNAFIVEPEGFDNHLQIIQMMSNGIDETNSKYFFNQIHGNTF